MPSCNLHTNFISKIFIFVISLATIIFLTLFLAPHSVTYTSNHEHVCDRADESNSISLVKTFLVKSLPQMKMAVESAGYMIRRTYDYKEKAALDDCLELMDLSIDKVKDTLMDLANWSSVSDSANNVHTWLSGILTNHITCFEGIEHTSQDSIKNLIQDLISKTRKSLAVLACLANSDKRFLQPLNGRFPQWALANIKDRKILESWSGHKVKADVVVAQDGSGDYRTVREAVGSAPDRSKSRYVIHVKKGIYKENVEVGKKKKNLMIVGDGMNKTIITGSRNAADGSTTFKSAALGNQNPTLYFSWPND